MFLSFRSQCGCLRFSVFRPEFLLVPRAVLVQNVLRTPYFAIAHPWGSGRPKRKMLISCALSGRNFGGVRIFTPKAPLAPGNCIFPFSAQPWDFSLSAKGRPRPKWPEIPVFYDFLPVGIRSGKTEDVKKLRTTILDSVVRFSFDFGTPSAGKLWFSVFISGPLAPGNYDFPFSARSRNFSQCQRPS